MNEKNNTIKLHKNSSKVLTFIKTDKEKLSYLVLKIYNLACQDRLNLDGRIEMSREDWQKEMEEIMNYSYDLKTMFGFFSSYDSETKQVLNKEF